MTPITDKLAAKWRIEYDNECWPDGEGGSTFEEWWAVTDGRISFKCEYQDDAQMLLAALAAFASQQAEPSEARVEAGARALAAIWEGAWGAVPNDMKEGLLHEARAVLKAADAVSAGVVPEGMKLVPDWKGYALLGTGRYLLDNSDAPADADLGAELIISLASEADRSGGRKIGERRDAGPRTIQPEDMVIRIGFANERGLYALEDQLWLLRQEHFPGTLPAPQQESAPGSEKKEGGNG